MLVAGGLGALPCIRGHNQSTLLTERPPLQLKRWCSRHIELNCALGSSPNSLGRCGWRLWATSARVAETQQEETHQVQSEELSAAEGVENG
jgi:hypothetical protein